ncbi:MAG TPA: FRG domain-containing protein [Polyangiaceae bacterium]|nr:FRG domain-containing protein [Polyangiaceae bacterium]
MPSNAKAVEVVSYSTAFALLEALRPTSEPWRSNPEGWVYRGHADSTWQLVPSLNRRAHLRKFLANVPEPVGDELYHAPTFGEARGLLDDFSEALDRAGLEVPGHSAPPSTEFLDLDAPFNGVQALASLAQHHGIPTWLLDWTRHAKVAAYFAASDVVHASAADGALAIWALNILDAQRPISALGVFDENIAGLEVVELPRASNANLHAQAGLFTFARQSLIRPEWDQPMALVPVDKLLAGAVERGELEGPMLYKLTLPRSEAGLLLKWLSYEPITGATMFPGLDGVARDVRDRRRWPK